ncbi:DUF4091 domain-containing protein [candidate division KSB1 bacterium]|nr:DUF4091 domain-containing protein [candidate division KSB1 bacterium]
MKVIAIDESFKLRKNGSISAEAILENQPQLGIHLSGAKNEILAFQIVLKAIESDFENITLSATHLKSKGGIIESENIKFFNEIYLEVSEPTTQMYGSPSSLGAGWYPDPLLPLNIENSYVPSSFTIHAQEFQIFWIDIYITPETNTGNYSGEIAICQNRKPIQKLPLTITVWDFALSDTTHFKTFFYFGPEQLRTTHHVAKNSPAARDLVWAYMQMAHEHRINLVTDVGIEDTWNYFDTEWAPFLDGTAFVNGPGKGIGCQLWPTNISIWDGKDYFQQKAQMVMEHFLDKGWFDKPFLYVIDEPDEGDYPEVQKVGAWLDDAPYPGNLLPFMLTEQYETKLVGSVDIWNSPRITQADMKSRQGSSDRFWTYNGGEPGSGSQCIDTDGWAMRSWPWIAWKGQREVWHYWDCCYFTDRVNRRGETDVWKNPLTYDQRPKGDVDYGNGDGTLFYPGQQVAYGINYLPGPISSFRMKALRRGIQDYEYIWMASKIAPKQQIDSIINQVLPHPVLGDALPGKTCYIKTTRPWRDARLQLATIIVRNSRK